jgi:hypothetical protein
MIIGALTASKEVVAGAGTLPAAMGKARDSAKRRGCGQAQIAVIPYTGQDIESQRMHCGG